jgi:hypothetical protein
LEKQRLYQARRVKHETPEEREQRLKSKRSSYQRRRLKKKVVRWTLVSLRIRISAAKSVKKVQKGMKFWGTGTLFSSKVCIQDMVIMKWSVLFELHIMCITEWWGYHGTIN